MPDESTVDNNLYAFAECNRIAIPKVGTLLIHRQSDRQLVVTPEVSRALNACRTFRTLEQHVEVLTSTIPQLAGQQADVANVLKMVKDAGLMIDAESVCQRLNQDGAEVSDPPATRVFIITCDRPAAIQRLLESMLRDCKLSSHEQLFLVDDSRDPQKAAINRESAANFNLTSPRNIQYVGPEEQQVLLEALVSELPEHEQSVRFLVDRQRWANHKTYGLARTTCLLLSVGYRAIVMDDDVICAAYQSPHKLDGVAFDNTPREVDFYTSEQDILNRSVKADFDPLAGHALCLGLPMSQAVQKLGIGSLQPHHLQNADTSFLGHWSGDSPVLITQSGTLGDPGSTNTRWIYQLAPNSSRRLLASPGGLESALVNRHYWLGQPRPQFTRLSIMSQVIGLDNSRLLPPYFPVFRGEDYLFGAMVEYLHPQAAVLEYDWSVPHFPMEQRRGVVDHQPATGKGRINPAKYVTDRTMYEAGISAETRLQHLAAISRALGETLDRDLRTIYRTEVALAQSVLLGEFKDFYRDGVPRSSEWQAYLKQSVESIGKALQQPASLKDIPGVPDAQDEHRILEEFRAYSNGFSSALGAWTAIREAAAVVTGQLLGSGQLMP